MRFEELMAAGAGSLKRELAVFERNRGVWAKKHDNKYALVYGDKAIGFYPDYQTAFATGLRKFGYGAQFLIKQVTPEEPVCVIF